MNGLLGPNALYMFILRAAAVLLVIPFHEAAHAFVSWKLAVSSVSSPTVSRSLPARDARRSWAFTRATISTGLKGLAM